jgi:molybdopterin/thiamine biosynthesis adenylyltransferase
MKKILSKRVGNLEEYLLGYKYQNDYRYMYIKINNQKSKRRLIGTSNVKIYPERVNIITSEFLRTRGGARSNQSKILLFGVGSLGSEVLSLLCKSGFRDITIVDNDLMSIYNTFRHVIGFDSSFERRNDKTAQIFRYKVDILKTQMEKMYPGTNISVQRNTIQEYLIDNVSQLKDYKYIISTTGNTIAEKMLNRVIYKEEIKTKLVFAWLEAFGIGRHILLNDGKSSGCIECLLKSSHYVRFLKPSDFKIYEDTCIGSYTDFGAIDSILLASEVVGFLLQFESGSEFKNRHIVKKGILKNRVDEKSINHMYYDKTQSDLDLMEYDFFYEGCDCCG